jgi:hypothetical protein
MENQMESPLVEYWTPEDCEAGICLPQDIGKARSAITEARKLTQRATLKAVKALVEVAEQNDDLGAKVKAAQALLDRAWGKPDQHTTSINSNVFQFPEMPWLTSQRLAYLQSAEVAEDILPKARNADLQLPEPVSPRDSGDPVPTYVPEK